MPAVPPTKLPSTAKDLYGAAGLATLGRSLATVSALSSKPVVTLYGIPERRVMIEPMLESQGSPKVVARLSRCRWSKSDRPRSARKLKLSAGSAPRKLKLSAESGDRRGVSSSEWESVYCASSCIRLSRVVRRPSVSPLYRELPEVSN